LVAVLDGLVLDVDTNTDATSACHRAFFPRVVSAGGLQNQLPRQLYLTVVLVADAVFWTLRVRWLFPAEPFAVRFVVPSLFFSVPLRSASSLKIAVTTRACLGLFACRFLL
jgi:hypothetical protein